MKIKFSLFLLSFFPFFLFSQFKVNNGAAIVRDNRHLSQGVDFICIINGISPLTELECAVEGTSFQWSEYSNSNSFISNQKSISPEDGLGYLLTVDGEEFTVWVFDYQNYLLSDQNKPLYVLEAANDCEDIALKFTGEIPNMSYKNRSGGSFSFPRKFTVAYESLEWNGDEWLTPQTPEKEQFNTEGLKEMIVKAPLKDTKFKLSDDSFVQELGFETAPFIESDLYLTNTLACKITTSLVVRDALNEYDRPKEIKQLKGSAPLELSFESNVNKSDGAYFNWSLYKDKNLQINRTGENQRYTFSEPGTYQLKLLVNNAGGCLAADSVEVVVTESSLEVPNIFTPNGDGKNDEFRVAYRSLESFHCWVYDSWGNEVFNWSNPAKGWDGRIGGREAPAGAYFYIIKAKGTDGVVYNRKGDINILR